MFSFIKTGREEGGTNRSQGLPTALTLEAPPGRQQPGLLGQDDLGSNSRSPSY